MQKFRNPCIKTGDFARLCGTNKRTLFHYDEIGLFSPALTDEKSYRYYSENQCDMFFTITCLKELGMPLKEIKRYIDGRNPKDFQQLLREQKEKIQQELDRLKKIETVIDTKLALVSQRESLSFTGRLSEVSVEAFPEERLIVSPRLDSADHDFLFSSLMKHIGYVNQHSLNTGHPYGAMLSVSSLLAEKWDTYAYFFTKVAETPKGQAFLRKPAGDYAVIYLKGDYYDASEAFQALLSFAKEQSLALGEFVYKEAVLDEISTDQEENYVTRISVPISPGHTPPPKI